MEGRVVRISIAPVKSLGLVHPEEVELGPTGVPGNRRFWLVDADHRLVNVKAHGSLVRIHPEWDEKTRRLVLSFPDGERVEGIVEPGEPVEAMLFSGPHASRWVPGPWEEALSRYFGEPLTLLWSDEGAVDRSARGGAATIVSRASLERLREQTGSSAPVDGRRFRMLFEVDGIGAHEEDEWLGRHVRVGEAVVEPLGDVGRCLATTRDPDTGVSDLDTLGALARYRRRGQVEDLPLGIYCAVVTPGRVRVGDGVGVLTAAPARTT
jgi:MOSC domain-containing protein